MPQGKLFMDKQNLSLQRQKQSRSSWKEISWCSVNNSCGFSSSLMRDIQDNLELCRSYLPREYNHFIKCLLTMRDNWKRSQFPPYWEASQFPQARGLFSPTLLCLDWKTGLTKGPHPPQHRAWHRAGAQQRSASRSVKPHFSQREMENVLSWR